MNYINILKNLVIFNPDGIYLIQYIINNKTYDFTDIYI